MAATVAGKKKRHGSRAPNAHRPAPAVVPTDDDGTVLMPIRAVVKGRWRIERQLAKGAFGQISVARDSQSNRLVAVKSEAIDAQMTFLRMEVSVLRALQVSSFWFVGLGSFVVSISKLNQTWPFSFRQRRVKCLDSSLAATRPKSTT